MLCDIAIPLIPRLGSCEHERINCQRGRSARSKSNRFKQVPPCTDNVMQWEGAQLQSPQGLIVCLSSSRFTGLPFARASECVALLLGDSMETFESVFKRAVIGGRLEMKSLV